MRIETARRPLGITRRALGNARKPLGMARTVLGKSDTTLCKLEVLALQALKLTFSQREREPHPQTKQFALHLTGGSIMNTELTNRVNMFKTVTAVLDENNSIWNSMAPFVTAVGAFKNKLTDIDATAQKQETPTGSAKDKEDSRNALEDACS